MMPTELSAVLPARHIQEECGVFGVYAPETTDVAPLAYYALYALQHRGQESAGIAVNDDGVFTAYRDVGLVNEVFPAERLRSLGTGTIAVGHVRYGTTGSDNKRNVQPILVNHYKGRMALAHNGNLTNSHALRQELESQGSIFQTTTDSEVIAYIITQERLNKAKEFLAQTNIHLYDVCYKVGYLSPSYFSRLFKKYTGQTPGEYRENIMLNARPAAEKEAEQL